MEKYRWNNPIEWVIHKITYDWDAIQTRDAFLSLIDRLDPDDIQNVFQEEMGYDGYFTLEG